MSVVAPAPDTIANDGHRFWGMQGAPSHFREVLLYEREPVTQLFEMLRAVTEKQW